MKKIYYIIIAVIILIVVFPLGPASERMPLIVRFHNRDVSDKLIKGAKVLDEGPQVEYESQPGQLYTLMILGNCVKYKSVMPKTINWIVINIPEDNINKGDEIVAYEPINPPKGILYKYTVYLFSQTGVVKVRPNMKYDFIDTTSKLFQSLKPVACVSFYCRF